ncbi:MAG: hypothetical protein IGS48_13700 [Oscillatoriales cyanobacterium C42_A2020_001]|nr:hypothetical protein [Leptolyngbyaceae cyanobacterium C42_A2020_001]
MTQKRVRRRSHSDSHSEYQSHVPQPARARRSTDKPLRDRRNPAWTDFRSQDASSNQTWLASLIEQDAPLKTNSMLVLMYGPFQAEMAPNNEQGIASWLRDCVRKHGLPSLVRFDYRQRAQVFRRDQFQPWLEPFLNKSA